MINTKNSNNKNSKNNNSNKPFSHCRKCKDHLGNTFSSVKEMCKHWGIPPQVFLQRMRVSKWDAKTALTTPIKRSVIVDHKGNCYPSVKVMCYTYNIPPETYYARRRQWGYSLQEALETPVNYRWHKITDPETGREYRNRHECAEALGFKNREIIGERLKKRNCSLAEVFFRGNLNNTESKDHLGNVFPTIRAMCKHWNINVSTFSFRISKGWSIEKALTEPRRIKKAVTNSSEQ